MIVSPGRRYVFVHAPKTGGTAMALALEARAMKDDILIGDTPKATQRRKRLQGLQTAGRLWKHSTLADIDGLLPREDLAGMFVFMLVRNPWDRMVSYYHWLRAQSFDHQAVRLARALDFDAFVAHPHTRASMRTSHFGHYVTDATGTERCDLFIRLEHLQSDLAPLEAHLGFALDDLPRVNPSDRDPDYRPYYTPQSRDLVTQFSARDIARFGYRFE